MSYYIHEEAFRTQGFITPRAMLHIMGVYTSTPEEIYTIINDDNQDPATNDVWNWNRAFEDVTRNIVPYQQMQVGTVYNGYFSLPNPIYTFNPNGFLWVRTPYSYRLPTSISAAEEYMAAYYLGVTNFQRTVFTVLNCAATATIKMYEADQPLPGNKTIRSIWETEVKPSLDVFATQYLSTPTLPSGCKELLSEPENTTQLSLVFAD